MTSPDDFARWCETEGIHTVITGAADTHGIWRGKRLSVRAFLDLAERGVPFSDVVLVITPDGSDGDEKLSSLICLETSDRLIVRQRCQRFRMSTAAVTGGERICLLTSSCQGSILWRRKGAFR